MRAFHVASIDRDGFNRFIHFHGAKCTYIATNRSHKMHVICIRCLDIFIRTLGRIGTSDTVVTKQTNLIDTVISLGFEHTDTIQYALSSSRNEVSNMSAMIMITVDSSCSENLTFSPYHCKQYFINAIALSLIIYPSNHIYYLLILSTMHLVISSVVYPQHKLTAYDAVDNERFGWASDIYDDFAFVGAYNDDPIATASGSVYVFKRNTDTWNFTQKLVPNDGAYEDNFGRTLRVFGSYAFIGAYGDDGNSGSVYIFNKVNETWFQSDKLVPDDLYSGARFSHNIDVYHEYTLIGAPSHDSVAAATMRGSAYFYERVNGAWIE
eukprot:358275_1